MTVNNLDSSLFPPDTFLNASSWGMKVSQTDHFLKIRFVDVDPEIHGVDQDKPRITNLLKYMQLQGGVGMARLSRRSSTLNRAWSLAQR